MKVEAPHGWTVEDLQEVYGLLLRFPNADPSRPDFWVNLRATKEFPARFATRDLAVLAALWKRILERSKGGMKLFINLMQDYVAALAKDRAVSEKLRNIIVSQFLGSTQEEAKTPVAEPHPHLAGKRPESEKGTIPLPAEPQAKLASKRPPPKLDLGKLTRMMAAPRLTKHFDEAERKALSEISAPAEDWKKIFVAHFKEVKTPQEKWKKMQILPADKKKPSDVNIGVMKRELKTLQEVYNKSVSEISDLYTRTSGDFDTMRAVLKGEKVAGVWADEEDAALRQQEGSDAYKKLLEKKGAAEVKKRKLFLGIDKA